MTPEEFNFIKECLGVHRKSYFYFKDKYALDITMFLLEDFQELRIGDLKKSRFAFLLQKGPVKDLVSKLGKNTITKEDIQAIRFPEGKGFSYTISEWGEYTPHRNDSYYQTSRPGINLVLRLNFDLKHNWIYNRLISPDKGSHPFALTGHPVSVKKEYTMSWARLDISLETGEVLVEEIQNDWLREVHRVLAYLEYWEKKGKDLSKYWLFEYTSLEKLRTYYSSLLKPYYKLWDEAILNLVLVFSKKELGIDSIYYHTYESGKYLKGYGSYSLPPRSVYSKLPKRFGFSETGEAPDFIRKEKYLKKKLRRKAVNWYKFAL